MPAGTYQEKVSETSSAAPTLMLTTKQDHDGRHRRHAQHAEQLLEHPILTYQIVPHPRQRPEIRPVDERGGTTRLGGVRALDVVPIKSAHEPVFLQNTDVLTSSQGRGARGLSRGRGSLLKPCWVRGVGGGGKGRGYIDEMRGGEQDRRVIHWLLAAILLTKNSEHECDRRAYLIYAYFIMCLCNLIQTALTEECCLATPLDGTCYRSGHYWRSWSHSY